jgi:NAD(P)-dependent dehydrogenase (short-subunit alcohol dehydrogenase family)
MLERNWGRVIFLSSESGVNIPDEMLHYGFTKTAVLALSRGLAKLARGTGVTVNAVLPGPTMSAGVERMLRGAAQKSGKTIEQVGAEFVKTKRATSIIQRVASAEEVGEHGRLCLLASGFGDDGRSAARRRRHRRDDRVKPELNGSNPHQTRSASRGVEQPPAMCHGSSRRR